MSNRYIVRFGSNRNVAEFTVHDGKDHRRSTQVVVKSDRGMEWGEVLGPRQPGPARSWATGNLEAGSSERPPTTTSDTSTT